MDARAKAVLLPAGGGVVEYVPQSLRHYVGLMFFPWLDGRRHHNAALRGGWTVMEAFNSMVRSGDFAFKPDPG